MTTEIEEVILQENGWVPDNGRLPVLIYRSAVKAEGEEAAERFERMFADHGWPPQWRDTIFDYHHYHSSAHEALGVATGYGTLLLGGPGGQEVEVSAGDALVLPVGTGHRRLEVSHDFMVVGAYPQGQDWDICREAPDDAAWRRIRALPVPAEDPILGTDGPLRKSWKA